MVFSNDPLADALNVLKTHKVAGRSQCEIRPASKLIREVLKLFQTKGYIGEFEFIDDGKSGSFRVKEIGPINNTGVIKPRFSVKKAEWPKWEQRYIPGPSFGLLVVTTPLGLLTNSEARAKGIGGRLIAYIY